MTEPHEPTIRTLDSTTIYTNTWLTLKEDRIQRPDGTHGTYSFLDKTDFALVIPMENNGFHLVEEYRYPIGRRTWSFPQGGVPDSPSPQATAHTELAEETGLTATHLTHLGHLDNAHGITTQRFDVFLATGLTPGTPHREHTEQDMRQNWFPRTQLEQMITNGTITDSCSIAAYTLLLLTPPQ